MFCLPLEIQDYVNLQSMGGVETLQAELVVVWNNFKCKKRCSTEFAESRVTLETELNSRILLSWRSVANLTFLASQRLRSEKLKQTFRDEENYTTELVDSVAEKYLDDVRTGKWDEEGWVENGGIETKFPMYSESKMFLNAYTMVLAKSLSKSQPEDHQILVAAYSPGFTQTDLMLQASKFGFELPPGLQPKSPTQGADTGVWLALLPKEDLAEKNGKFFGNREEWCFGWES